MTAACDDRWNKFIDEARETGVLHQHNANTAILKGPPYRVVRIKHPSMLGGQVFHDWNLWCRHHLSEKQIERLEEKLPLLCNKPNSEEGDDA